MKKYVAVAVLAMVAVVPSFAHAATFAARDAYTLDPQDRIAGSLYVASNTVVIGGTVSGDLLVAGNSVSVTGPVAGDVMGGGANIQLLAPVQGDVRVGGGKISVNDRVGGDLVTVGGTTAVLSGSVVSGNVYAVGGEMTIDGTVNGSVVMRGGRLVINGTVLGDVDARVDDSVVVGSNARVLGTLTYRAPREAAVGTGARIGAMSFIPAAVAKSALAAGAKGVLWAVLGVLTAMRMLMMLGCAALLVWRWRRETLEILQSAYDRFWGSAGLGLAYAFLVPLGALLLIVSIIGTLPGLIVLALVFIVAILAKVMASMFFGVWLQKVIKKNAALQLDWPWALGGIVLLQVASVVPVIGFLAKSLLCLVIFGAIARRVQRMLA